MRPPHGRGKKRGRRRKIAAVRDLTLAASRVAQALVFTVGLGTAGFSWAGLSWLGWDFGSLDFAGSDFESLGFVASGLTSLVFCDSGFNSPQSSMITLARGRPEFEPRFSIFRTVSIPSTTRP